MRKPPLEVEVKFYLSDMPAFEKRLRSIGASLLRPRTHELNYRFDTQDMTLTREHRVLRLRQDNAVQLTYKGPAQPNESVSIREEIELEVNDFQAACDLLEALGYRLSVKYEKWRAIYQLNGLEIALDEMPFGNFTEIEGGDLPVIQKTASMLALNWNNRITVSYMLLFDRLKKNKHLPDTDLTFADLRSVASSPEDLDVKASDTPYFL